MSYGTNPQDDASVPIAAVFVPGDTLRALQGSTTTNTDGSGRVSSPANFNLSQIGSIATQMAGSDSVTASNILMLVPGLWNGTNVDMQRANRDNITLLASAAITSNSNSTDQTNHNAKGVKVYIKTGSFGASESTMVVNIQIKDPVSAQYFTVLSSASLTASTFSVLTVYPGVTASANVALSDVLPRTWRVSYTASNWGTGGSTLGIACAYIL